MEEQLPQRRIRASDAERDQILTVVQRAYEAGRLDLSEMRDRQDLALRATYLDDLPEIVADLPEGRGLAPLGEGVVVEPVEDYRTSVPETAPSDAGFTMSVMSGRDVRVESGTRTLRNFAWWGGNNYDLTDAMGPGRIVTLTLNAVMGGNDIVVPEGVRVVDQSLAIMAGNDIEREALGDGSNGTLVLKGFLWWGGNNVRVAGEDVRRRRRR